jgi:hypothetical protein
MTGPGIALAQPVWQCGDWLGNVADDFGVDWTVTTETGWSARPAPRTNDTDRDDADGDYVGPSTYSARTITLQGTAVADSPREMNAAKDRFLAAGAILNQDLLFIEYGRDLIRQALVRPADTWTAADHGPLAFDFQLVVKAADPRKYNAYETSIDMVLPHDAPAAGDIYLDMFTGTYGTLTSGWPFPWPLPWQFNKTIGGVYTVNNIGSYPTLPTYLITGPVALPAITNSTTGEQLKLNIVLAAGETLLVDVSAEAVLLNGTTPRQAVIGVNSRFPTLAPGSNRLVFTAGVYSADSICTLTYRDAWI